MYTIVHDFQRILEVSESAIPRFDIGPNLFHAWVNNENIRSLTFLFMSNIHIPVKWSCIEI